MKRRRRGRGSEKQNGQKRHAFNFILHTLHIYLVFEGLVQCKQYHFRKKERSGGRHCHCHRRRRRRCHCHNGTSRQSERFLVVHFIFILFSSSVLFICALLEHFILFLFFAVAVVVFVISYSFCFSSSVCMESSEYVHFLLSSLRCVLFLFFIFLFLYYVYS